MTPIEMVVTSLLLGLFVALAGCYGVLFCVGRLRANRRVVYAAYAAYGIQAMVAASLVLLTPLGDWWKLLIAASCAVYLLIPPATWRYLENLHQLEEQDS
jgi:hypothetical protein